MEGPLHPEILRVLKEIHHQLHLINQKEDAIMSGLTDLQANFTALQAAFTSLTTEWTTFLADVTTALGNEDSDAAVEAVAQLVATATTSIQNQTAAMQAADPENPVPSGS